METKKEKAGLALLMDRTRRSPLHKLSNNAKPQKPNEIPQPGKNPETIPAEEPEPGVWPRREPEIQPEREPLTVPPTAPPDVPAPPNFFKCACKTPIHFRILAAALRRSSPVPYENISRMFKVSLQRDNNANHVIKSASHQ